LYQARILIPVSEVVFEDGWEINSPTIQVSKMIQKGSGLAG